MSRRKANGTLAESAYDLIRNKILTGEYPPGTPLSRRRLGESFRMSLIPVAEALQRLENENFVESRPRVGTRVKIPSAEEISGHYLVREALESQAARQFVERAGAKQKRELRQMARRLDALSAAAEKAGARREEATYEFETAHHAFHRHIAESSGCVQLVDAIERSRVLILNWLFAVSTRLGALPPRWHTELVEVLAGGDLLAADAAMRKHVRYRREEIIRVFEAQYGRDASKDPIVRGPQRKRPAKAAAGKRRGEQAAGRAR